jgi:hypothetical protein
MGLLSQTQGQYYNSSNSANYGDYQFVTLENIISAFKVAYVGENKIINKVSSVDIQFHAMRAIQELSYDVFRSFKSQEIEVPNTLKMILPQDYVNYVKLTMLGENGIEKILYPTSKTSNPFAVTQDANGVYQFEDKRVLTLTVPDSSQIADSDYLELFHNPADGTPIDLLDGAGGSDSYKVHFIFDTDGDFDDFTEPSGEEQGPKFIVSLGSGALTSDEVAVLLAQQINLFGHHTAVVSGSTITVTYNEKLNFTDGSNTFINALGSGIQTTGNGVIESFQAAGTDDTTQDSAYTTVITTSGSGANTITEQVNSNTLDSFNATPVASSSTSLENDDEIDLYNDSRGRRYGLDPASAQNNGSFYIDYLRGFIHFGSSLAGKTVTLKYVSDGLGTDSEMVVHKFCEEAVYKWIFYGIVSSRANMPEAIVARYKKERFAETRKAKIRLSNIKIEEFTQVLKGMGKQIK